METPGINRDVAALEQELSASRDQQAATSAILCAIAVSPLEIQSVLEMIAETAARFCKAYDAVITLRDRDFLAIRAHHGPSPATIDKMPIERGWVTAKAFLDCCPIQVEDLQAAEQFPADRDLALRHGHRTTLAVPLVRNKKAMGALTVRRLEVKPFSQNDITLLIALANQAVIAIENVRLFEESQQRNRELSATSEVLRVIAQSPTDVQPVFDVIAECAARLCGSEHAHVDQFDGSYVHFVAHFGLTPEDEAATRRAFPRVPDRGTAGARAILTGQVVQIPNLDLDPDYVLKDEAKAAQVHSAIAVPMLRQGKPIGAIVVDRKELGYYPDHQVDLLRTFADQAVIAIENAGLFKQVQMRSEELSEALQQQTATADVLKVISRSAFDLQVVLDTLTSSAAQLCDADMGSIARQKVDGFYYATNYRLPPDWQEYVKDKQLGPGRGSVIGRALLEGKVVQIADVRADPEYTFLDQAKKEWFRTLLGVPLMREGTPIGVIALGRANVRPFSERQIELVQTFADQAVIAIENTRLFDQVQARTLELEKSGQELAEALQQQTATADVLKAISRSTFDLQTVLDTLVESAARLCGANVTQLFRLEGPILRWVAGFALNPSYLEIQKGRTFPRDKSSLVGRVAIAGHPVHVLDALADPEYGYKAHAEVGNIRTMMGVPLLRSGELIGVIALARDRVESFGEKQIEIVMTFADQAVIAIENARLFEEVQARTRELESSSHELREALQQQTATADVLKAISHSTFDLERVLQTLTESAAKLCNASYGGILLRKGERLSGSTLFGGSEEDAMDLSSRTYPIDRATISGRVALSGKIEHIADIEKDQEYGIEHQRWVKTTRAMMGVPLLREGNVQGVFFLGKAEPGAFSERQGQLVQTFADQAVIAIENVRLFDEVRARTSELTESLQQQTATADVLKVISRSTFDLETVLQTLVESAARLCDADMAVITRQIDGVFYYTESYGFSPEVKELMRNIPITPNRGSAAGRALMEGKVNQIPDVLVDPEYTFSPEAQKLGGFRTVLGVPMLREGTPIGAFALGRPDVRLFTDKQIELVSTFADQAAIAIENARLFEEVRARTEELSEALQQQTATAEVLKTISRSTFDLKSVLQTLVESAARLCDADVANITRQIDGAFYRTEFYGMAPELIDRIRGTPVIPDRGSAQGRALLEGRIVHIADVESDPDYTFDAAKAQGTRTLLGVPMMREGKPIGSMALGRVEVRPFTDKQIELISTFADQAAIAIENVRLFASVEARTRELAKSLEDLRSTQDRLLQTQKLASLGQLTAGIAHEIKNPLNFVNNFAALSVELLGEIKDGLREANSDEKREELGQSMSLLSANLTKISEHGRRADSIIKNMLLHSRQGSGESRVANINSLLEESLNLAYHGARAERPDFTITLERAFDVEAGEVELFPQEITRVFLNLISNGFYATAQRKLASATTGYEPALAVKSKNLGDRVEIKIRDNGTGMPTEIRDKIFNPFFTTKPPGEGTGLGLSLSHDIIVKQHGGSIDFETQSGEFTEFTIVLPREGPAGVQRPY